MKRLLGCFYTITLLILWFPNVAVTDTADYVATIKPLQSLVQGVLGKTDKVLLLLSDNASPHDFHFKPSQIRALNHAKAIFYINPEFETFLSDTLKALPADVKKINVSAAPGVMFLKRRTGGIWEAHGHDDEHDDEHDDGHDDEHDDGHDNHSYDHEEHEEEHQIAGNDYDMHIWLNPNNAKSIVHFIVDELSALDPENKALFEQNGERMVDHINELDKKINAELQNVRDVPYIVFHDAYQYFENAYRLNGVGSILLDPEITPSPRRIKQVRDRVKESGATCIFREPQFSDRVINTVTDGIESNVAKLDPLGAHLPQDEQAYFQLMQTMADNLHDCLSK